MPFKPDHWRNPRKTIATKYEKDDFAYAIHGAWQAVEVLRRLDLKPSEASKLTILDYGCGTGRIARVLTPMFKKVYAWDPVPECVAHGRKEGINLPGGSLLLTDNWNHVSGAGVDLVVSVNVIEHLNHHDADVMLRRIKQASKPGARLLLWYDMIANRQVLAEHFSDNIVAEDNAERAANPSARIRIREFPL